ncbi:MAG: hypothetical protein R3C52_06420 [Hyphomonadaceae bacterium]
MSIWWTIPGFVGLVGLFAVIAGLGRIFKLRIVSGGLRFLFGGVLLGAAAVVGLVGLNLQTYARLTAERLAAEVTLRANGPTGYVVSVSRADKNGVLGAPEDYMLTGDGFRMEADVITFKPWANVLGVDALYRLDRIQGRYDSEAQEIAAPPKPYSLRQDAGISVFDLPLGAGNPFRRVDAEFVNGVAVPMADGATYEIFMSQRGLIPRPKNEAATQAVEQRREGRNSGAIYDAPDSLATQVPGATPSAAPAATDLPEGTPPETPQP